MISTTRTRVSLCPRLLTRVLVNREETRSTLVLLIIDQLIKNNRRSSIRTVHRTDRKVNLAITQLWQTPAGIRRSSLSYQSVSDAFRSRSGSNHGPSSRINITIARRDSALLCTVSTSILLPDYDWLALSMPVIVEEALPNNRQIMPTSFGTVTTRLISGAHGAIGLKLALGETLEWARNLASTSVRPALLDPCVSLKK